MKEGFERLLERYGVAVTHVAKTETIERGIVTHVTTEQEIKMILQPLRADEILALSEFGVVAGSLKAYAPLDAEINVGDEIVYEGVNYSVVAVETTIAMRKLILRRL